MGCRNIKNAAGSLSIGELAASLNEKVATAQAEYIGQADKEPK